MTTEESEEGAPTVSTWDYELVKGISLASENAVGMATRIYNRSKYLKLNSYITNKADTVERISVARHQQDTNILPIELGSGN